jgi:hypothetical protein
MFAIKARCVDNFAEIPDLSIQALIPLDSKGQMVYHLWGKRDPNSDPLRVTRNSQQSAATLVGRGISDPWSARWRIHRRFFTDIYIKIWIRPQFGQNKWPWGISKNVKVNTMAKPNRPRAVVLTYTLTSWCSCIVEGHDRNKSWRLLTIMKGLFKLNKTIRQVGLTFSAVIFQLPVAGGINRFG